MIKIPDGLKAVKLVKMKAYSHPLNPIIDEYKDLVKRKVIDKDNSRLEALKKQRQDLTGREYGKWLLHKIITR